LKYVLWDWNGTLLDDTQAAVDALNASIDKRGLRPIGVDFYRDTFGFPVKPFYRRIGMPPDAEDWDALAKEYHENYARQPKRLNVEAIAALERVRAAGLRQSIVSALRQDLLDAATAAYGVAPYMEWICGTDNLDGASKLGCARSLLTRIMATLDPCDREPGNVVLIGDALHDLEVAEAIGVRCVLCAQGSHAAWRLRSVAPTGETLSEAVDLALGPVGAGM